MIDTNGNPKAPPSGKKTVPLTPDDRKRRFADESAGFGTDQGKTLDRMLGTMVLPEAHGWNPSGWVRIRLVAYP